LLFEELKPDGLVLDGSLQKDGGLEVTAVLRNVRRRQFPPGLHEADS